MYSEAELLEGDWIKGCYAQQWINVLLGGGWQRGGHSGRACGGHSSLLALPALSPSLPWVEPFSSFIPFHHAVYALKSAYHGLIPENVSQNKPLIL